ncbi:MAG: tyrosine-type recombinase/integrase [Bacteroidetes bacterium]|nr:tyrosine-type recombinase/integrase [Bacteroidota bacterium]
MQKIKLQFLLHHHQECIGIYFDKNPSINKTIQENAGAKWSASNKCWYIPLSKENYNKLVSVLKNKVDIEKSGLHKYLLDKKQKETAISNIAFRNSITVNSQLQLSEVKKKAIYAPQPEKKPIVIYKIQKIHPINAHVLPAMQQQLKLRAYSPSTIKTYFNEMSQLLQTINSIPADALTPEHLRRYLVYCYEKLSLTENTLHSRINALKFYYEQVLGREKFFWEIPRPKKRHILPKVLGETEIRRLFTALQNKKHKAVLFTAYSAGLRVSEVVNLQLTHIDRSRMQLFIKDAKGKKDRYVMLSPVLLDILTNYYKTANPRPIKYLFEGPEPGTAYSASSMQRIFQIARKNAGIGKELSFHSLRHSFATHLLEKGIDIKYIKELLGHFDIKTTARYLHVKKEHLINIESPLDSLFIKDDI